MFVIVPVALLVTIKIISTLATWIAANGLALANSATSALLAFASWDYNVKFVMEIENWTATLMQQHQAKTRSGLLVETITSVR